MVNEMCSVAARRRGDQMLGTASRVDRWLLVEQPGPWGPPAVPTGRMDPDVARHITALAAAANARLLLVRRPGGRSLSGGRQVFVVDSRPGQERQLTATVSGEEQLPMLTLPLGAGVPADPPWSEVGAPLLLVCTHGRHDQCCAIWGRPVAAALAAVRPHQTWECSHVGGDRFAANVVMLPHGLYFGDVSPGDAVALADAMDSGAVPPALLRGRSSLSVVGQAAQQYARLDLRRDRLEDLLPSRQEQTGPNSWRVLLRGAHEPDVEVEVLYDRAGEGGPALLTCGAQESKVAPVFRLLSLRVMSPL